MTHKLSAADWRIISAVLAVIFLLVATEPSDDCSDCENEKLTVTFIDNFPKKEMYKDNVLPNAVAIVHLKDKVKGKEATNIPLKSGESKTIQLEGREVYTYIILELKWDVNAMNNLGWIDTARLVIDPEYAATFASSTRLIEVGAILVDTTISFAK